MTNLFSSCPPIRTTIFELCRFCFVFFLLFRLHWTDLYWFWNDLSFVWQLSIQDAIEFQLTVIFFDWRVFFGFYWKNDSFEISSIFWGMDSCVCYVWKIVQTEWKWFILCVYLFVHQCIVAQPTTHLNTWISNLGTLQKETDLLIGVFLDLLHKLLRSLIEISIRIENENFNLDSEIQNTNEILNWNLWHCKWNANRINCCNCFVAHCSTHTLFLVICNLTEFLFCFVLFVLYTMFLKTHFNTSKAKCFVFVCLDVPVRRRAFHLVELDFVWSSFLLSLLLSLSFTLTDSFFSHFLSVCLTF